MAILEETESPQVVTLVTGHFHSDAAYKTWRERGTGDWLLIYTLSGGGRFGKGVGERRVGPGEAVLIAPGTRHEYGTSPQDASWELLWTHFHPRPHWHDWLGWPELSPGLHHLALTEPIIRRKIEGRLRDAHQLASGASRLRGPLAMNALEEALLWCETQNPCTAQSGRDPRVQVIMDYLCAHLADRVAADALTGLAHLSPSRLAHLFHEQIDLTPSQFLEQQRLNRAAQLLSLTPLSVQAIARQVGYENPFYFTLRFKKQTGFSPTEYRKQERSA